MSAGQRRQLDRLLRGMVGAVAGGRDRLNNPVGYKPRSYWQTPTDVRFYLAQSEIATLLDTGPGSLDLPDGSTVTIPQERRFTSLVEISDYVSDLTQISWPGFEHRFGDRVQVRAEPDVRFAAYSGGVLRIPDGSNLWAWRELVVLHEFAHHLLSPHMHHGPPYGRAHRMLMSHALGPEVDYLYGVIMQKHGVQL